MGDVQPPATLSPHYPIESRASRATQLTDQPPMAPHTPMTHVSGQWSRYRRGWEQYSERWNRYWVQTVQLEYATPVEGEQQYHKAWQAHWQALGQPWRWQPEIDEKRQQFLARKRAILPDIEKGLYPFKNERLSRADVEWLLATHEGGKGPVDVNDPQQQDRIGIDLRGANLRQVDLRSLPLACMYGGLDWDQWKQTTNIAQQEAAAIHLEGANLREVHLERARLRRAHLEGANLRMAHLEGAPLFLAHLEGADLFKAHLEGASLREAHLEGKKIPTDDAELVNQWLKATSVWPPADLRLAYFDHITSLDNVVLGNEQYGFVSVADLHWGGTNLSVIDWSGVEMLGDEREARQGKTVTGVKKQSEERLNEYRSAVRANHQLAIALREQGINDGAASFAYRALLMQRKELWWRLRTHQLKVLGLYLFSWFLAILTGYGYRMWRILVCYMFLILLFAGAYWAADRQMPHPLTIWQALIVSITAFHGRVFSYNPFTLSNPQIVVTAFEAIVGLIIEGVFIAMLTQRFFNR